MALLAFALGVGAPAGASAQTLRGSMASVDRQNHIARQHAYTFMANEERVLFFASQGWLVEVRPTADFVLKGVSFPYARPEVELFIRRLGAQFHSRCGEPMVVTSLTRPLSEQPRNASDRSVHPTGMAVDLRRPWGACRAWLEGVLLDLERAGVLDATMERRPVHYHIALFPRQYAAYVAARQPKDTTVVRTAAVEATVEHATAEQAAATSEQAAATAKVLAYRVRRGDSLWTIARAHGTTVDRLRLANELGQSSRIFPGQVLDVPLGE